MNQAQEELRSRLLRAAALRGAFEPRQLMREVLSEDEYRNRVLRARLMSSLRELSHVDKSGSSTKWILRLTARHRELSGIEEFDSAATQTEIVQALSGREGFAPSALDHLIEAETDEQNLSQHLVTLERAGQKAPGYDRLFRLRSRLNLLRRERRSKERLGEKFVGRVSEIDMIQRWIDHPLRHAPLKTLHIEGQYGIGKSYLLERIIQITSEREDVILIRLDFDQPSLQTGPIFEEISRQIGTAIPQAAPELRNLRLRYSEQVTREIYESSDLTPRQLIRAMINAVADAGLRLVILLDTLEVLDGQGATFVNNLMSDLDRFVEKEQIEVSIISAGRGPIFGDDHPRRGEYIKLDQIEDELVNQTLDEAGIPEEFRDQIILRCQGNPLKLRLLIDEVQTEGRLAEVSEDENDPIAAGIVNRAVTSRLPVHLRGIANYGMVLSEINADNLNGIVAPALGLGDLSDEAGTIVADLGLQSWLMDAATEGQLTHKADMRRDLLEPTYSQSPIETAQVNRAACAYYADRDPLLFLYHSLQLMRVGEAAPSIDPSLAERFPEHLLTELPIDAQDLIRQARGQRSAPVQKTEQREYSAAGLDSGSDLPPSKLVQISPKAATARAQIIKSRGYVASPDERAVNDLRAMLEQGQRREATHIIREGLRGAYDPASEVGILILCHNWQSGHWSMARDLFNLLPEDTVLRQMHERPELEGRILLEVLGEFRFRQLIENLHDKEFHEVALRVVNRSSRIGMQSAALEFALIAMGMSFEGDHEVLGLIAPYLDHGPRELTYERLRFAGGIRQEFGLEYLEPDMPNPDLPTDDYGLALAPLNPYFDRMLALVDEFQVSGRGRVLSDLSNLATGLYEAADIFAPGLQGIDDAMAQMSDRPTDVLSLLRAMGLTADWAEGYSFYHPIPDLPTLARAARRWQQVIGGYWAFPSPPPPEWNSTRKWSDLTSSRTVDLLERGSHGLADRVLNFWADPLNEGRGKSTQTLQRRLAPVARGLTHGSGTEEILGWLTKSRAPVVFHPALTMFAETGRGPKYLDL
ncbi:ATP-binding protein [Ruegeria faecimaris]|uniref:ATP-binding protein n=1 Tax=Ruegeria faecimaris TaxID=686389 RepID=UPI0024931416|nr:ATP-binding protein [Ruegeria faecimaris]